MKKVHPSTKRAIIRQHEKNTQLRIIIEGKTLVQVTLDQLRALNQLAGLPADLTYIFGRGTILPINPPPRPEDDEEFPIKI